MLNRRKQSCRTTAMRQFSLETIIVGACISLHALNATRIIKRNTFRVHRKPNERETFHVNYNEYKEIFGFYCFESRDDGWLHEQWRGRQRIRWEYWVLTQCGGVCVCVPRIDRSHHNTRWWARRSITALSNCGNRTHESRRLFAFGGGARKRVAGVTVRRERETLSNFHK